MESNLFSREVGSMHGLQREMEIEMKQVLDEKKAKRETWNKTCLVKVEVRVKLGDYANRG